MLAFFNVPRLIVTFMTSLEFGYYGTALVIAGLFLFFGLFIDAIPTIIILGTVLLPVAAAADIHPVVFAIIGIVSLAFGLVTPPYGLCLLISASIGGMNVVQVMRDVVIILIPMLLILLLIIIFPEIALWLPKTLMPTTFR
jgi:TRAP-type C4-dicarboxylate transport system permease large subunit